ncbi:hypothetical protein K474DRAFT_1584923 [Panus rudis PR-1116 ss-1]|nr:hypothetical protein K474DRAFT_1584923 [Panus rudis PR-1116 ss-1]
MYSHSDRDSRAGLDTPPPSSQFRRPWSPEAFDPNPSRTLPNYPDLDNHPIPQSRISGHARREASDVSVEALDLADYAHALNRNNPNPYAVHFTPSTMLSQPQPVRPYGQYGQYPPSPPQMRSFAMDSRDSLTTPPLTSAATASSYADSNPSRSYAPQRRPFSLPAPSRPQQSNSGHSGDGRQGIYHGFQAPHEIDIAQFPAFSRGWYGSNPARGPATSNDPYDPFSPSNSLYHGSKDSHKPSPFDPGLNAFSSPPPSYPHIASHVSRSSRDVDVLPWSADPPENHPPLDEDIKEERVRMLEREFGGKGKAKDYEEEIVGSVDQKGRLITDGPKKRLAVRWLQVLLALLAGGSSIYAALIIKLPSPPPPAGKPQTYILYVLSVLTFLFCTYFFLIYPSCCGPRKATALSSPYGSGPGGMMILPVQGPPGGKKGKKNKKGKKGGGPGGDVQVNLIVDPTMFNGGASPEDSSDDEFSPSEFGGMPGSFTTSSNRHHRHRHHRKNRRRGIFEGLAMEARWKRARKLLKWGMVADMACMALWGGEFVLILMGKRCPIGSFEGWCDAYNLSTAAACLLCVAFGLSVFFDIKDLHSSKASPRTRT